MAIASVPIHRLAQRVNRKLTRLRPPFRRKVIGIGLPKTGTTLLGLALKQLGYKHHGYDMDLAYDYCACGAIQSVLSRARAYESFEDWPWHLVYRQFDETFPDSKFVLTERISTHAYLRSHRSHGVRFGQMDPVRVPKPFWWDALMPDRYGTFSEEGWRYLYEAHSREVRSYFKNRPTDLLVVCWEAGDGWNPLCSFLGRRMPHAEFPHANKA